MKNTIKTLLITALSLINSTGGRKTDTSNLPPECKDLNLIIGNPMTAKTILFGEIHRDQKCYNSMRLCTEALSRNIPKADKVALVEGIPHNLKTLCADEADRKLALNFDECNGWDAPRKELDDIDRVADKMSALLQLYEYMQEEIRNLNARDCKEMIAYWETIIKKCENSFQEKFLQYKKTHHHENIENFFTRDIKKIGTLQVQLRSLKKMHDYLKSGMNYKDAFSLAVTKEMKAAGKQAGLQLLDPKDLLETRNKYLFKTIKKYSKNKSKLFVFAGKQHVNTEGKYAKELFNNLDQFVDENPYAVLACKV